MKFKVAWRLSLGDFPMAPKAPIWHLLHNTSKCVAVVWWVLLRSNALGSDVNIVCGGVSEHGMIVGSMHGRCSLGLRSRIKANLPVV